jgi:hypothetical protein
MSPWNFWKWWDSRTGLRCRPPRLSLGEQQRVALARAIVSRPDIVIFDEPIASLDGLTGRRIISFVKENLLNENGCRTGTGGEKSSTGLNLGPKKRDTLQLANIPRNFGATGRFCPPFCPQKGPLGAKLCRRKKNFRKILRISC